MKLIKETRRINTPDGWNTRRNHAAWKLYLREMYGAKDIPAYASPAKQTDYSGLPPAYSFVCEGEPFYSETLAYIGRLQRAGIEAKVDVYPGDTHAFDMMRPLWPVSKRAVDAFNEQFRYAVSHHYAPQPDA